MALRPDERSNLHLSPYTQEEEEHWWEGSSTSEEEMGSSDYDSDHLNLGVESPASDSVTNLLHNTAFVEQWAAAGVAVPRVPARRPSWRSTSFRKGDRERGSTGLRKEVDDRDCGICFEYAVVPCRTLCCGKIFCNEHLADWLHGPNAQGRCPNCENPCALEGGTLSLAPPSLRSSSSSRIPPSRRTTLTPAKFPSTYSSSPLTVVFPHLNNDTLNGTRDASRSPSKHTSNTGSIPPVAAATQANAVTWVVTAPSATSSTSNSSTAVSSDPAASSMDEDVERHHRLHRKRLEEHLGISSTSFSTTPFSTSWGAVSRLMSIITFLMFLYKLLS